MQLTHTPRYIDETEGETLNKLALQTSIDAQSVYEDALRKLEWNMRRGKDDRADYWCILAVTLEELYGVQRPKHLQENA
jgi:hypothetical protein